MDNHYIESTFNILIAMLTPKGHYEVVRTLKKAQEQFRAEVNRAMMPLTDNEKILVADGLTINAIKSYKNRTGATLRDSKNKVDEYKKIVLKHEMLQL